MSNSLLYDATKHNVHSVSAFQAKCAEVNRRIKVQLKKGQNEVVVTNIPTCLLEDSIRVDGIGRAVILDVVYIPPPLADPQRHADALRALNNQKSALEAEWRILENQEKVLSDYSKTLKGSDTSANQLVAFLSVYEEKQSKLNERSAVLKEKTRLVDDDIRDAQITLNADEESLKRAVKITVIVLADDDGPAELSLTYVVSNAWWAPLYDLRAAVAHDAKSTTTLRLHYRASVSQSTGEDWSSVALTLSTASPLQGVTIPTLHPEWVGEKHEPLREHLESVSSVYTSRPQVRASWPYPSRRRRGSRSPVDASPSPPPMMGLASAAVNVLTSGPPPGFFPMQNSALAEGAVSTTFTIAGLSSIPSNTGESSQTHKVSIAEIELNTVELEWVTIPKVVPSVFLQCNVPNTSEYVLLPGQTSIFMDNNFVAKSTISHVSPKESFSCSLGVDPAVRVTYHPQSKKTKSSGNYILTSKTRSTTFRQHITVKNTRPTTLHKLVITDQVPVSDNECIKVNVIDPKELQIGSKGAKETVVGKGVKARWGQKNGNGRSMEEGGGETGLGFVEWICEIGPNASVDVDLAWDVVAPAGVEWIKR